MSDADLQWVVNAHAHLRRLPAPRRPRRRPHGAQAHLPRRRRRLHGRVAPERAGADVRGAHRLPRPPGARRGADRPGGTRSSRPRSRGGGADEGDGRVAAIAVGGAAVGLVLGGILTTALSWPWIFYVNVPVGIAVFIASMRFVPESKDEHAHKSFDVAGAVTRDRRPPRARLRDRQGAGEGLGVAAHGRLLLARVRAARGLRRHRAALVEPLVRLGIFRVRTVRAANVVMFLVAAGLFAMFYFNDALLPARARLRARSRARVPPVHRGSHRRRRLVAGPRAEARRPRSAADRDADGHPRAPALRAAPARRVVRRRLAGDHARVDRDGHDVRAHHAHRDERDLPRRRRARIGPLQHVAADRRRAGPRSSRRLRSRRPTTR